MHQKYITIEQLLKMYNIHLFWIAFNIFKFLINYNIKNYIKKLFIKNFCYDSLECNNLLLLLQKKNNFLNNTNYLCIIVIFLIVLYKKYSIYDKDLINFINLIFLLDNIVYNNLLINIITDKNFNSYQSYINNNYLFLEINIIKNYYLVFEIITVSVYSIFLLSSLTYGLSIGIYNLYDKIKNYKIKWNDNVSIHPVKLEKIV